MKTRMLATAALAAALLPPATAHATTAGGYRLATAICTPRPVPNTCVATDRAQSYGAFCVAYVAGYQVGDPTTTIWMAAYAYDTSASWTEVYCAALHDGNPVAAVYGFANGPTVQASSVATISTAALPSSLDCWANTNNISMIC